MVHPALGFDVDYTRVLITIRYNRTGGDSKQDMY
jgi:hypothetical protein